MFCIKKKNNKMKWNNPKKLLVRSKIFFFLTCIVIIYNIHILTYTILAKVSGVARECKKISYLKKKIDIK